MSIPDDLEDKRALAEVYHDLSCYRNWNFLSDYSWSLNLTTKPFVKHYHFPAAMTLHSQFSFFSYLGFSISSSTKLNDDSLRAWPFLPHTVQRWCHYGFVCWQAPVLYRLTILYSKTLGLGVLNFLNISNIQIF